MSLSTKELEARENELIPILDTLEHSYPSDGWDGAAEAIAAHVRKIQEVERELLQIHQQLGRHRPDVQRYYPEHLCICGESFDSPLAA
jgi:hypothetical protein